ncbi:MAG: Cof-type HAD-IIB family hydrolase [Clostridium sp.]|nr:Cof-type HAD-IIB family hydrolase [Clostridium sp.]
MKEKKIIFFDIDGTLISDKNYTIPDSTVTALKELKSKGNLAFINTGRTSYEITDVIRKLDFDGYVCGCGTYVEYKDKVLLSKSLGTEKTSEIIQDIINCKLEAILESQTGIYFDKPENITHKIILQIIEQHKIEGFYKSNTWYQDNIDINKFVIFLNSNSNFETFFNKYKAEFDFIKRTDDFYEVVPKGYSKASGIEFIINKLNIPYENTFAIGDSTNDLPMLKYVNTSIAMGNSSPEIFDSVSYITTDLHNNGIHNALKHFNLI